MFYSNVMYPVRIHSEKVLNIFCGVKKELNLLWFQKHFYYFAPLRFLILISKKHFQVFHQGIMQEISSTRLILPLYLQNKNEFVQFIVEVLPRVNIG